MPVVTVRFLGLAALSPVILLSIPNTRAMSHIARYFPSPSLTQADIASTFNSPSEGKDQFIPKIIHQISHDWEDPSNETVPADWDDVHQSCVTTNPDFEYRLWTTNSSRQFVETHYEWFLKTYDSYTYPEQRANALRSFLMRHHGGIYIDAMYGCSSDLDPLLYYPAWVMDSSHGITGARPNHPYWVMMTESLIPRGFSFLFPHATHSSSPEFGGVNWDKYHARMPSKQRKEDRVYRIKTGHRDQVFFMPNGRFRDNYGYIASTKAILGCLLLFAMLTRSVSRSWQARKTYQREYQKLLPAKDLAGWYVAV